jgi:hypothetical protein
LKLESENKHLLERLQQANLETTKLTNQLASRLVNQQLTSQLELDLRTATCQIDLLTDRLNKSQLLNKKIILELDQLEHIKQKQFVSQLEFEKLASRLSFAEEQLRMERDLRMRSEHMIRDEERTAANRQLVDQEKTLQNVQRLLDESLLNASQLESQLQETHVNEKVLKHSGVVSGNLYEQDVVDVLENYLGEWCHVERTSKEKKVSDVHIRTRDDNIFILLELKHKQETYLHLAIARDQIARFEDDTRRTGADRGILFTNARIDMDRSYVQQGHFSFVGNHNYAMLWRAIMDHVISVRIERLAEQWRPEVVILGQKETPDFVQQLVKGYSQLTDLLHQQKTALDSFWVGAGLQTNTSVLDKLEQVIEAVPAFGFERFRMDLLKHRTRKRKNNTPTLVIKKEEEKQEETTKRSKKVPNKL